MLKLLTDTKLYACGLAAMAMSFTACDSKDVGAVAIGAGVIAVCSSSDVHCGYGGSYYRRGYYGRSYINHGISSRRRSRSRINRGRISSGRRSVGSVNRGSRGNRGRLNFNAESASFSQFSQTSAHQIPTIMELGTLSIQPSDWSATFGVSLESSAKIIDAFEQVKLDNPKFLITLGLNDKDIKRIGKLKMLKESGVQRMAASLNEPVDKVEAMLETVIGIAKEELETSEQ